MGQRVGLKFWRRDIESKADLTFGTFYIEILKDLFSGVHLNCASNSNTRITLIGIGGVSWHSSEYVILIPIPTANYSLETV